MPCVVCGDLVTCRAHLIPAAFGKDILKRTGSKGLSLLAPERTDNFNQSGIFDANILCATCDGTLSAYDDHALEVFRLIGTRDETVDREAGTFTISRTSAIDHGKIALFGAAVVLRTSMSNYRELAEFSLGQREKWFREMLFCQSKEIPAVMIARLIGGNEHIEEAAMTAQSYPVLIKRRGKYIARFIVGGFMFLVQTTRAPDRLNLRDAVTAMGKSKGSNSLTGWLMPFENLADLSQARNSRYIKKVLGEA